MKPWYMMELHCIYGFQQLQLLWSVPSGWQGSQMPKPAKDEPPCSRASAVAMFCHGDVEELFVQL